MSSRIPTAAREAVKARDQGRCQRCGGLGTDIHHRMRRREGGHGLWNLVTLCRRDHDWVHAHPMEARDTGYIISVHLLDPELVRLRVWTGDWQRNNADGSFSLSREQYAL